jgi:arabinogalactan oligomer / maltooligosaccharide transport system permease protein
MPGERGVPYAAARTALILGEFGHSPSKEATIEALDAPHRTAVEGAPEHSVVTIVKDETVSMLVTDPTSGAVQIGDTSGLRPVDAADVTMTDGSATALAGYETLNLGSLKGNVDYTAQWNVLCVPMPDGQGRFLCPIAMTRAALFSSLAYDEGADTLTDPATGEVFRADDEEQSFVSESTGEQLVPGWRPS